MKKITYNIRFMNKKTNKKGTEEIRPIHGYTFEYSGIRYGITNNYYFNNDEEKGWTWNITELTTGLLIGCYAGTQKEAIEKLVSPEFKKTRDAVKKAVDHYLKEGGKDINAETKIQNTILSIYAA